MAFTQYSVQNNVCVGHTRHCATRLQLIGLLEYFKAVAGEAGGAEALTVLLTCVSNTCHASGGSEQLASMLQASSDLIKACGSADKLHELLKGTATLMNAYGRFSALHGTLRTLAVTNDKFGGAEEMFNLIQDACRRDPAPAEPSVVPADSEALEALQQVLCLVFPGWTCRGVLPSAAALHEDTEPKWRPEYVMSRVFTCRRLSSCRTGSRQVNER